MGDRTGISWTDATWNPIRGCSRVSPGCVHCYAETVAGRFSKPGQAYDGLTDHNGRWNGKIMVVEKHMLDPIRWRTPRKIFVNSMSDLFHENIGDHVIDAVFAVMAQASRHTFQILTKRPQRMLEYCAARQLGLPLPNVWLGVSCEDQTTADERIPLLLETPAAVRFVSAEPLLDVVRLSQDWRDYLVGWRAEPVHVCGGDPQRCYRQCPEAVQVQTQHLDWVIIGGESGTGHRRMEVAWAEELAAQCIRAGVPLFVKQDSGSKPGQQGRLAGTLWAHKEFPQAVPA